MKYSHLTQTPTSDDLSTVVAHIEQLASDKKLDSIHVAMAYVSVAGVRDLLGVLHDRQLGQSRWLIGIDDAVSQPGAIELCRDLKHSAVRVASFEEIALRFHPKALLMTSSSAPAIGFMMVGSANLTHHGLSRNAESVVFLHAESVADVSELVSKWDELWKLGRRMDDKELQAYRARYNKNKAIRGKFARSGKRTKTTPKKAKPVLASDKAEMDPSLAKTCWIECGFITAMGRELEIKAEQGLFFGLNPRGEAPRIFAFELSDGNTAQLRMKYQGNAMWRLQLTNQVPEVSRGLRPMKPDGKLGRSPWVAVIRRRKKTGTFRLRFIRLRSVAFNELKRRSKSVGAVGKTTAREYGWH